jgi:glutathione S-transferase
MNLYVFQVAPNPTRVRLYLAEKTLGGAKIDVNEVSVNLVEGEQQRAEHIERNSVGKLPVLELKEKSFLTESLAIIEYFEELHPDPPMIGSDAEERARVRELERVAEMGVLLPVARIVHATNSPLGWPPVPEMAAFFQGALPDGLRTLDAQLSDGRPFVAGQNPTIIDCTLAAALQFARFGKVEIDPSFEHVARWDRFYRERAVAQSVLSL